MRGRSNDIQRCMYDEIFITKHARERFLQRMGNCSGADVYRIMISMINKSRLISSKNEDGQIYEHRESRGFIFVCAVSKSDNFFMRNKTTVVTVELADTKIKQYISQNNNINALDLGFKKENKFSN